MRQWLDKEETDDDKVCLEVQGRKKKQPSTDILQNKRVELKWSRWCWCELQTMTEMLKVHSEASYNALLKLCALFLTFRSRLESKLEMEGKDCNRYLLKETLRSSLWSWLLLSLKKRGNDDDSFFFFDFGCCFSNRCSENKFRSVLLRRTTPIFWSHIRFRLLSSLSWERGSHQGDWTPLLIPFMLSFLQCHKMSVLCSRHDLLQVELHEQDSRSPSSWNNPRV